MSSLRRNILGIRGQGSFLPYDAEVEYLESTGTQYIDLGLKLFDEDPTTFDITLDVSVNTGNTITSCVLNAMYEVSPYPGMVVRTNGNNIQHTGSGVSDTTITICGVRVSFVVSRTNVSSQHITSTTLFAGYDGSGNPWRYCKMKLYSCIIHKGDTTMWLVPVRKGQTGYLYDKISGQLFGNKGTGSFIIGQYAEDSYKPYDAEVEYLQNNGLCYIKTGIVLNMDMGIGVVVRHYSSASQWKLLFGWRKAVNSNQYQINYNTGTYSYVVDYNINGSSIVSKGVSGMNLGEWHTIKVIPDPLTNTLYTSYNQSWERKTGTGLECYLFCSNYNGNAENRNQKLDLAESWIYDNNGRVIQHLIPVRIGEVGYMFDKINGKLFANAGTGTFILGNDIN